MTKASGAWVALLDPHAANVRTAIDSSANNRFDIYILLELFPLQHVRCFRSSHLSFAVVNASGQKARFHAEKSVQSGQVA
jgi:hypothetical protein